jgi:Uncharacterized protein conserved in bacteria (DUF2252)
MAGARAEAGRALRKVVPRSSHAAWDPAGRPSPLPLLEETDRHRLPELVPIRAARMRASPFAFLRGAPAVMARDLATTPVTGITVQACGDAHLRNFGLFATPERNLSFGLNDFDETLPAPWGVGRQAAGHQLRGGRADGRVRPGAGPSGGPGRGRCLPRAAGPVRRDAAAGGVVLAGRRGRHRGHVPGAAAAGDGPGR